MNFKVGQKVRVVGKNNNCAHAFPIGTIVTITSIGGTHHGQALIACTNTSISQNIMEGDLRPLALSREELKADLDDKTNKAKEAAAAVDVAARRLKFLDETGEETLDENVFKAYYALAEAENSDKPLVERAKAIAKLISAE